MNQPERNLYKKVKEGLNKLGVWLGRLEDINMMGLPDTLYTLDNIPGAGFIEFKYKADFPKKHATPVRLDHFTPVQRAWFQMHGPRIQRVFLLLQISDSHFLFPWTTIKNLGNLKRVDLFQLAEKQGGSWGRRINYQEMEKLLRRNYAEKSGSYQCDNSRCIKAEWQQR